MSNGNEEIDEFVEKLLEKPPGLPNSIQFEIDTDGDVAALFEVLLLTMTAILKTWYPSPISIATISQEDLARLTAYFSSFGIEFRLTIDTAWTTLAVNNREYLTQSRLEDMRFRLAHHGSLYTVRFSNRAMR